MCFQRANCRGLLFSYRYLCRTRQTSAPALSDRVELAAPCVRKTRLGHLPVDCRSAGSRRIGPEECVDLVRGRGGRSGTIQGSPGGSFARYACPVGSMPASPSWASMNRVIGLRIELSAQRAAALRCASRDRWAVGSSLPRRHGLVLVADNDLLPIAPLMRKFRANRATLVENYIVNCA